MIRNSRFLSSRTRLCLQKRRYSLSRYVDIAPEVQDALQSNLPIVALESTIITHGMPYPTNLTTALSVETQVRSTGAIPATIAILKGRIIVGMTKSQLEYISVNNSYEDFIKVSRRDLAPMVGLKLSGGTTISATSLIASSVGIKIFATGGLGGVHRGGEVTWDISADLTELGRTPIAVVSAGVKSILDIEKTLEYLETQGVSVMTYGPDKKFPGFYVPDSGYKSTWNVNSPEEAAKIIEANHTLNLQSGMLFAAPIPEQFSKDAAIIQEAVDRAVKESEEKHINKLGKEATPWILRRVADLSQGKSLPSNIALIENTARIGAQIAVEYAKLRRNGESSSKTCNFPTIKQFECIDTTASNGVLMEVSAGVRQGSKPLLVIGGAVMDVIGQQDSNSLSELNGLHTTFPGEVKFSPGGVARNVAEAAHRILSTSENSRDTQVLLISPVGNDYAGRTLVNDCKRLGMRTDGIIFKEGRTAICSQVLDSNGELLTGIADMSILEMAESTPILSLIEAQLPGLIAFDANSGPQTLSDILTHCVKRQIPTFFEPTSVPKSTYILPALKNVLQLEHHQSTPVTFASPNRLELLHMYEGMKLSEDTLIGGRFWWSIMDDLVLGETYRSDLANFSRAIHTSEGLNLFEEGILQIAASLIPFFQHLFIKLGKHGVLVVMRIPTDIDQFSWKDERTSMAKHQVLAKGKNSLLVLKHYPALSLNKQRIINVTGAGDSFAGSLLTDLIGKEFLSPKQLDKAVERAQYAAVFSLISPEAVSPKLRFGNRNMFV